MFLTKDADPCMGVCEICGEAQRRLRPLFIGEIMCVCDDCAAQLDKCAARRYCATGEETEPAE